MGFVLEEFGPFFLPFLGFIAAKLKGQRYAVLVHDLWPELPAHTGMIRKGGILYRAIDFVTKGSLKNKFTFSGVEAPVWQGARRANSELFNRRATQSCGMDRRIKM